MSSQPLPMRGKLKKGGGLLNAPPILMVMYIALFYNKSVSMSSETVSILSAKS